MVRFSSSRFLPFRAVVWSITMEIMQSLSLYNQGALSDPGDIHTSCVYFLGSKIIVVALNRRYTLVLWDQLGLSVAA